MDNNTFTISGEPLVKRKFDLGNYQFIEASMQVFFRLHIPVGMMPEVPILTHQVFQLLNDMMLNNVIVQGIRAKAPEVAHIESEGIRLGLPAAEFPEGVSLEIFKISVAYGRTLKAKGNRGSMTPRFSLSFNVPDMDLHEFMESFWVMARENVKYTVKKELTGQPSQADGMFLGFPSFDAFAPTPVPAVDPLALPVVAAETLVVEAV